MSRAVASIEPVAPDVESAKAARTLADLLPSNTESARLSLVDGANGVAAELPPAVINVLRQVLEHLGAGRTVSIIPAEAEFTPNEAADYLNVSRTFVLKLLDEGQIPFRRVGSHRRIRFGDLREYEKRQRDQAALEKSFGLHPSVPTSKRRAPRRPSPLPAAAAREVTRRRSSPPTPGFRRRYGPSRRPWPGVSSVPHAGT
jgi:excisionase family DNA binding protein